MIGPDEPEMALDFDLIEAEGARRLRRRRAMVPTALAVLAVGAIAGGTVLTTSLVPAGDSATDVAGRGSGVVRDPGTTSSPAADRTAIPSVRTMGYCYRTADITDPDPDQHILVGLSGNDPDGRGDLVGDITDICRTSWEQNLYNFQPDKPGTDTYPVPDLAVCVLTDAAAEAQEGAVAVFPGGPETCRALGLPTADLTE